MLENNHNALNDIFKRDDLRGFWPEVLNCEVALWLGQALGEMAAGAGIQESRAAIGYDARQGSYELSLALMRGLSQAGIRSTLLGLASSEQLYYACGRYSQKYCLGIMVTASHNPKEYNGMKFVWSGAVPFSETDLQQLRIRLLEKAQYPPTQPLGEEFAQHLLSLADYDSLPQNSASERLRAVVLAGSGVGGQAFKPLVKMLRESGIDCLLREEIPDGRFPRGVPDPLSPEYMRRLSQYVLEAKGDIGIAFDGDADRAGFIDNQGQEILSAQVFALVALRKLSATPISRPILMRNLCCSQLISELFTGPQSRIELIDTPVGHGQIKRLMRHPAFAERMLFAGEHSGHYFYPEFYSVDSGMLTTLHLLAEARELKAKGGSLAQRLQAWRQRYAWSGERNFILSQPTELFAVLEAVARAAADLIPGALRQEVRLDPQLGLPRVFATAPGQDYRPREMTCPDLKMLSPASAVGGCWLVLRPSGNEGKLRLNIETWGHLRDKCAELSGEISSLLSRQGAKALP